MLYLGIFCSLFVLFDTDLVVIDTSWKNGSRLTTSYQEMKRKKTSFGKVPKSNQIIVKT
jgi:hypothetical protein